MSRIDLHRRQSAQTAEFGHHQDLRMSAYSIATKTIGDLLGTVFACKYMYTYVVNYDTSRSICL